ncbi:MAG: helicase-exonuclease AddAB subunit AddA [Bacillales bacterium]|jgi:ATP-dependent helicase/nuclease subunit A|nr:helicase-exonuclease AddAB subunit AddA [Bacillales bacterium]
MLNSIPVKPINEKWTDDQWKAIYARGNDILVAAAAGSGKTAVLVERIIKRILDEKNPIEVDRLLVVTFTNAAAQEMRSRIGEAIEKELKKNPSSLHLRKQLSILNSASISTIHSFCLEVIRNYYYEINIDPGFRIGNEAELQILKDDVLEELLESEYSNEVNEDFFNLVDAYTSDSDDSTLRNLVLKLYTFAINTPNPTEYLEKVREAYNISKINTIDDLVITHRLKNSIAIELEGALTNLKGSEDCCNGVNGPVVYLPNLQEEISQVADALEFTNNSTWESIRAKVASIEFKRLKPTKDVDAELLENAKAQRDSAKKIIGKIKEKYFQRSESSLLNDIKALYPLVCKLTNLVESFTEMFSKEKQSLGIVDFSDLEHYCLEILRNPNVSLYYKKKFAEIYVDEYQDTNFVQEEIIRSVVSEIGNKGNRFMVGDVKQSIYRFRLAEPNLFLEKYKTYTKDGTKTGIRIDLSKNFRSRSEVLDSTNFIFECIMDEAVGEIEYDKDARLYLGATNYPECDEMSTELLIINSNEEVAESQIDDEESTKTDDDNFEDLERSQIEARVIAKKIIEMREQNFLVYNGKTDQKLPLKNKDIVILVRSMTWVPEMMEELNKQGIKVYAELSTGYFNAVEIGIFLSLLKVIDNPQQDIPLASVLRSPLVGLNEPSLAHIRSYDRSDSFYEALKYYVNNPPENVNQEVLVKVKRFTDNLNKWRTMARKTSLADFIWVLYRETGYFDFVAGLPAGKQRQANLRVLYERAKSFEKTAYQGLFRFLQYIERMKKRGDDLGTARALSEQEDVVRIMTIHKSKGLEFPVVFISNLGKQFNMQDLNSSSLIDKELGIGLQHVRTDLSVRLDTLPLLAIKEKAKLEQLSEEMRVLYVALTRAKEKLIMVGTIKNKDKMIKDWNLTCDAHGVLPRYSRIKAKSYIDWVGPAFGKLLDFAEDSGVYKDDKVNIKFKFINKHDVNDVSSVEEVDDLGWMDFIKKREIIPNVDVDIDIDARMNWIYPYENLTKVPANLTVTEIKRRSQQIEQDEGLAKTIAPMPFLWDRPTFMKEKDMTATERGTATHKIMQFISITSNKNVADVECELDSMLDKELITKEDRDVVDVQKIIKFFESNIANRLINATRNWRELPFNYAIPVSDVYQQISSNEKVFVKGIIDCMFEEDDELVILDFKTDKIIGKYKDAETGKRILVGNYRKQLEIYKRAIEEITNKKVKESNLYLFDINEEVKLH